MINVAKKSGDIWCDCDTTIVGPVSALMYPIKFTLEVEMATVFLPKFFS